MLGKTTRFLASHTLEVWPVQTWIFWSMTRTQGKGLTKPGSREEQEGVGEGFWEEVTMQWWNPDSTAPR